MNPAIESGPKFSAYRYSGTAANLIWTLGWAGATFMAVQRWRSIGDPDDSMNALLSLVLALFGCMTAVKAFPRAGTPELVKKYPTESLAKRISGWFASVVWGGFAALWNMGVFGVLLRAAHDGNTGCILIMIPFSLIGWFLMLLLCVMITMAFDSLVEMIRGALQSRPGDDGQYPPKS